MICGNGSLIDVYVKKDIYVSVQTGNRSGIYIINARPPSAMEITELLMDDKLEALLMDDKPEELLMDGKPEELLMDGKLEELLMYNNTTILYRN